MVSEKLIFYQENHKRVIPLEGDNDYSTDEHEFLRARETNVRDIKLSLK